MGLLCGEGFVILTSTVFDWSTRVTDGRTDGLAIECSMLFIIMRYFNTEFLSLTKEVANCYIHRGPLKKVPLLFLW